MAQFGLFSPGGKQPLNTYEGDYMQQNGQYVLIFRYPRPGDQDQTHKQVAAVSLDKGQSVKQIA